MRSEKYLAVMLHYCSLSHSNPAAHAGVEMTRLIAREFERARLVKCQTSSTVFPAASLTWFRSPCSISGRGVGVAHRTPGPKYVSIHVLRSSGKQTTGAAC